MGWIVLGGTVIGSAVLVWVVARGRARRRRILEQPFPDSWMTILQRNLPPYPKLPVALQDELQRDIKLFLAEKTFEGCGGQEITDEVRVTIAAQACLLLLGRPASNYPRLHSIIVYPHTYVANDGNTGASSVRLGESWNHGVVVLSWNSVRGGALNFDDGHNVTMHEFAHQLDQEDGNADGAPILAERSAYRSWARICSKEFERLQKRSRRSSRSVMDDYGATNPAEFFAVATETFFEKPEKLSEKHPELYAELLHYYQVNPLEWV